MKMINSIAVYCGSSDRVHPEFLEAAYKMGSAIARRGIRLVYGAGCTGLMGTLADGALNAKGEVIGVIPTIFNTPQLAHNNLTQLILVDSMHQRKFQVAEMADAFIALPGGFGTFEELFEILTWSQVGLHDKPIGLLNSRHYFDPLFALIQHAEIEGMIYAEHQELFTQAEDPELLLDRLIDFQRPSGMERWVQRDGDVDNGQAQ